jgi:hypothetical protein
LSETGYFEGQNLAFEYRTAESHLERLPALADNLVRLKVAAIIATSLAPALAAQAATKSIPIIFLAGTDPVDTGLVGSLNRPGGNLTGVNILGNASSGKRLELLHELVPTASIAYITNVGDPGSEAPQFAVAARTLGIRSHIVDVRDKSEIEATFLALVGEGVGGSAGRCAAGRERELGPAPPSHHTARPCMAPEVSGLCGVFHERLWGVNFSRSNPSFGCVLVASSRRGNSGVVGNQWVMSRLKGEQMRHEKGG